MTVRNREPNRVPRRVFNVSTDVSTPMASGERVDSFPAVEAKFAPEFSAFYRRSYQSVARALSVTLRDGELGAEAADEAMARCFSRWGTIRNYDNPAGWVYRVGLNWARSWRRRLAHRSPIEPEPAVESPPAADPEIYRALSDLDVRLRSVVVCRYLLDWSTEVTAEALNLRPGTVKSRLHRAVGLLEVKLEHLK